MNDRTGLPGPCADLGLDADKLRRLVALLAQADLDCALELSRMILTAEQMGQFAAELARRGRSPIARAWLRRATHELDTLHMQWLRLQAQAGPPVERRDSGWPPLAD